MALTEIEKYQRKLKRLIDNVPDGYKVCYDAGILGLYVVAEDAEFYDNEPPSMPANYPGGGCSYGATSGVTSHDTGNDRNSIIGDFIEVDMQAAQQ